MASKLPRGSTMLSYLSLSLPPKRAKKRVAGLRKARITPFKAKDIFRASQLSLLGVSNSHVERDAVYSLDEDALIPCKIV